MDRLEHMLEKNAELRKAVFDKHYVKMTRNQWIQWNVFAMFTEMAEAANETGFKWWKENAIEEDKLAEEMIDVLHFWMEVMEAIGYDSKAIYEEYLRKNKINIERLEKHG